MGYISPRVIKLVYHSFYFPLRLGRPTISLLYSTIPILNEVLENIKAIKGIANSYSIGDK